MYYRPESSLHGSHGQKRATSASESATSGNSLVRNRRLIAQNTVFSVFFDDLVYPDGRQVSNYLSVVPRTLTASGLSGVAVLPEVDGKLGLLRVHRHPLNALSWEMPRGFIDHGESAIDAAQRELTEETGLTVEPGQLVPLAMLAPEPGVLNARVQMFAALKCAGVGDSQRGEPGHREYRLFSLAEVEELIESNEINDPCTLVGFYRFTRLRGK